jgi:hypothetical protein
MASMNEISEETMTLELEINLTEEQKDEICGYKPPRKRILAMAVPRYEHESSKYPEQIRVSFGDGHTAIYDMRVEQPHPLVLKNIEIMKETKKKITQGYVNQPQRRRRRRG